MLPRRRSRSSRPRSSSSTTRLAARPLAFAIALGRFLCLTWVRLQLLSVREELSGGVDRRVEEELSRLKQKAEHDVKEAQSHARELFERENLALREARDTAREEAERQTAALKAANAANSQLEIDYRTLTATTEAQLSEIRNRLKLKSFEHERVAGRRCRCGCRSETASRSTELEARLSQSSKQLEHYEMIEAEL